MSDQRTKNALTRLLKSGDPAAHDPGLDPTERALMRQRLLAAGREGRQRATGWLLPAATAVALLALALGLALRQPQAQPPERVAEAPPAASADSSTGQQIQFTTDSGILVVWVLQPKLTS